MSGSVLTQFPFIQENSLATPGLWNSVFSQLSQNIAEANTGSIISGGLSLGTRGLTISVPSNSTDYIFLNDSTNLRSSYVIGSFTTQTGDGLNIYDASGQTMIVSFSKQSVRFYQQVSGLLFDTGGALFNVKAFGAKGDGVTDDSLAIQNTIFNAGTGGIVYLPSGNTFSINTTLLYNDQTVITSGSAGTASKGAVLLWNGPAGEVMISSSSTGKASFGCQISNLEINGNSLAGVGINFIHMSRGLIDGCYIHHVSNGTGAGVQYYRNRDRGYACYYNVLQRSNIEFCTYGLLYTGEGSGSTTNAANSNHVLDCTFSSNQTSVWVERANDIAIIACGSEFPGNGHIWISGGDGVHIIASRIESEVTTTLPGIFIGPNSSRVMEVGNYFVGFTGAFADPVTDQSTLSDTIRLSPLGTGVAGGSTPGLGQVTDFRTSRLWAMPSTKLVDINGGPGAAGASSGTGRIRFNRSTAADGNNVVEFYNGTGTLQASITSFGGSQVTSGSTAYPAYAFQSDASTGIYFQTPQTIALSRGSLDLRVNGVALIVNPIYGSGLLDLNGGTLSGSAGGVIRVNRSSNANAAGNSMEFYNNSGTIQASITSIGNLAAADGTGTIPAYRFTAEAALGLYRSAASTIALSWGTFDLTKNGAVTSIASLRIKSGTNNSCGTAVLGSNGSVNVANTYVAAGDLIFLTDQTAGGTLGDIELGGIRAGSGFTILSTSVTDTSTVAWLIIRPN